MSYSEQEYIEVHTLGSAPAITAMSNISSAVSPKEEEEENALPGQAL